MVDVKCGTGRTTRMILAAGEYLMADPERTVVMVNHTSNYSWLRDACRSVLSEELCNRIKFQSYQTWQSQGTGRTEGRFFDHHCFYNEYANLTARLEVVGKEFTRYD